MFWPWEPHPAPLATPRERRKNGSFMNIDQELQDVVKLAAAYVLALPVGYYREKEAHSVGLRTFPVVAMASCGYVLLAAGTGAHPSLDAQSRVIQGVVAGIGFVGGGAILKSENRSEERRVGEEGRSR